MWVPPNHTEAEVVKVIDTIAAKIGPSFVFGYYTLDDIKQLCHEFAIELLSKNKYNPSMPLENYLFKHIKNRLLNEQRNKKWRPEPPCQKCNDGYPCGDDGKTCDRHNAWFSRNQRKASALSPVDISCAGFAQIVCEPEVESAAALDEIVNLIDAELSVELRSIYLRMRANLQVPQADRLAVEEAVRQLFYKYGIFECPSADE